MIFIKNVKICTVFRIALLTAFIPVASCVRDAGTPASEEKAGASRLDSVFVLGMVCDDQYIKYVRNLTRDETAKFIEFHALPKVPIVGLTIPLPPRDFYYIQEKEEWEGNEQMVFMFEKDGRPLEGYTFASAEAERAWLRFIGEVLRNSPRVSCCEVIEANR